jgi:hypothetical protein
MSNEKQSDDDPDPKSRARAFVRKSVVILVFRGVLFLVGLAAFLPALVAGPIWGGVAMLVMTVGLFGFPFLQPPWRNLPDDPEQRFGMLWIALNGLFVYVSMVVMFSLFALCTASYSGHDLAGSAHDAAGWWMLVALGVQSIAVYLATRIPACFTGVRDSYRAISDGSESGAST